MSGNHLLLGHTQCCRVPTNLHYRLTPVRLSEDRVRSVRLLVIIASQRRSDVVAGPSLQGTSTDASSQAIEQVQ